ncbi:PKD domain-containing protein [bacterium]|nr:PKD domain-containing protein [bacterium]
MPSPSSLPRPAGPVNRGTSLSEIDVFRTADSVEPLLPQRNTSVPAGLTELDFAPLASGGTALSRTAFSAYSFSVPGYDRSSRVVLQWSASPASGQQFVALADWSADRWVFFAVDEDQIAAVGDMQRFIDGDGRLLLYVLLAGTQPGRLASLRLGQPAPVALLSATPDGGPAPLSGLLDASASTTPAGTITRYDFDLDGDGIFELDNGLDATVDFDYSEQGSYQPAVRVVNDFGEFTIASADVNVLDYWQHSFGGTYLDTAVDVLPLANSELLLLAQINEDPMVSSNSYSALIKMNRFGEVIWARRSQIDGNLQPRAMTQDSSGNIIVVGEVLVSGSRYRAWVQKLDPQGQPLWSRSLDVSDTLDTFNSLTSSFNDVLAVGNDIYFCGGYEFVSPSSDFFSNGRVLLGHLDTDGGSDWLRASDTFQGRDEAFCMVLRSSITVLDPDTLMLMGRAEEYDFHDDQVITRALRVDYDREGNYLGASRLDVPETFLMNITAARSSGFSPSQFRLHLTGYFQNKGGSVSGTYYLRIRAAGDSDQGCIIPSTFGANTLSFGDAGKLLLPSRRFDNSSVVMRVDPLTGQVLGTADSSQLKQESLSGALPFVNGLVYFGSATDNSGTWSPDVASSSSFNCGWSAFGITEPSFSYTADFLGITSSDIAADVEASLDIGAGQSDILIGYMPEP